MKRKILLTPSEMDNLKSLGFPHEDYEASGGWVGTRSPIIRGDIKRSIEIEGTVPGYFLEDLLEIVPREISGGYQFLFLPPSEVYYWNPTTGETKVSFRDPDPVDSVYKLLCWTLENKVWKKEKFGSEEKKASEESSSSN